ncbi:CTD kinase subunit gamma CTK3-domain-containing protein [Hypoxylon crocopeplum]|nr:CTD kinase subunit gamma CTK3-domain-containing protein [Hypoxylon crocopeplum]
MATADPFEVRMRFSGQLQHLNASTTSAQKAAQYALKYKDMSEDLHSCILEQLEKTSMNTRANIMYFLEHLLENASKERHNDYVRMMQRDIIRVVDAVCPEDGSGAANVKVVRKVLHSLTSKCILLEQTVTEIEGCLKERDTSADLGFSSPANGDNTTRPRNGNGPTSSNRPDKRQIEQRIEEDRERHKRMRENMWAVPQSFEEEAAKLFEETSDLGEDDRILGAEEWEAFKEEMEAAKCRHLQGKGPTLSSAALNGASSH